MFEDVFVRLHGSKLTLSRGDYYQLNSFSGTENVMPLTQTLLFLKKKRLIMGSYRSTEQDCACLFSTCDDSKRRTHPHMWEARGGKEATHDRGRNWTTAAYGFLKASL